MRTRTCLDMFLDKLPMTKNNCFYLKLGLSEIEIENHFRTSGSIFTDYGTFSIEYSFSLAFMVFVYASVEHIWSQQVQCMNERCLPVHGSFMYFFYFLLTLGIFLFFCDHKILFKNFINDLYYFIL